MIIETFISKPITNKITNYKSARSSLKIYTKVKGRKKDEINREIIKDSFFSSSSRHFSWSAALVLWGTINKNTFSLAFLTG